MVEARDIVWHQLPRTMAGDALLPQVYPLVSFKRRAEFDSRSLRELHKTQPLTPALSNRYCISRHDKLRRELPAAVEIDSLPLRRRFGWPSQTEKWVRQIEEARRVA